MAQVPDAYVAVSAVRKVRQAAAMAHEHLTDPAARAQLGEAIEDFDRELPGVKDARDVLEHFDEYTRGVGDLQQPSVRPRHQRVPDEALAERYRPMLDYVDNDPQRPRVTVGSVVVDLVGAAELASVLVHEIYAAIRTAEGNPHGRELVAGFLGVPARMAGLIRT